MPKLIKNNAIVENEWALLDKDTTLSEVLVHPSENLLIPVNLWLSGKADLQESGKTFGVWLDSNESPDLISIDVDYLQLIALNFPTFMDGRSYTNAATLRQRYAYKGELRAIGDVLRDQLFYMKRCGFDSFEIRDEVKDEDALSAFNDFSTNYQATVEEPVPLYRRR